MEVNEEKPEERRSHTRRQADVARDAVIPHLRKIVTGAIACWAIIATVAGVALLIQTSHNTSALHRAEHAVAKSNAAVAKSNAAVRTSLTAIALQHKLLLQGCIRSNLTRASDNASHQSDYSIDSFVLARFLIPNPSETPEQKRITSAFKARLLLAVTLKRWTPLTDCVVAIGKFGSAYKAPQPVPFSKKQPPASALSLQNAGLPAPVGSVGNVAPQVP